METKCVSTAWLQPSCRSRTDGRTMRRRGERNEKLELDTASTPIASQAKPSRVLMLRSRSDSSVCRVLYCYCKPHLAAAMLQCKDGRGNRVAESCGTGERGGERATTTVATRRRPSSKARNRRRRALSGQQRAGSAETERGSRPELKDAAFGVQRTRLFFFFFGQAQLQRQELWAWLHGRMASCIDASGKAAAALVPLPLPPEHPYRRNDIKHMKASKRDEPASTRALWTGRRFCGRRSTATVACGGCSSAMHLPGSQARQGGDRMKHGPPCLPGTLQVHSRVWGPALELGRCDLCFTPHRVALRRDLRAAGRVPFFHSRVAGRAAGIRICCFRFPAPCSAALPRSVGVGRQFARSRHAPLCTAPDLDAQPSFRVF